MLASLQLSPFNRNVWSEKSETAFEEKQAEKASKQFENKVSSKFNNAGSYIENTVTSLGSEIQSVF